MFFACKRLSDNQTVVINKKAVRLAEPAGPAEIRLHIDGIGEIITDTYDIFGFASLVAGVDEDTLGELAEAA